MKKPRAAVLKTGKLKLSEALSRVYYEASCETCKETTYVDLQQCIDRYGPHTKISIVMARRRCEKCKDKVQITEEKVRFYHSTCARCTKPDWGKERIVKVRGKPLQAVLRAPGSYCVCSEPREVTNLKEPSNMDARDVKDTDNILAVIMALAIAVEDNATWNRVAAWNRKNPNPDVNEILRKVRKQRSAKRSDEGLASD
jgi:hypothetical protein